MEDINIILSFINEYKENFQDNDYKNVMNALRRIYYYNKKSNEYDIFEGENMEEIQQSILSNSTPYDFMKVNSWRLYFLHRYGDRFLFNPEKIYKFYFQKYYELTGNENDIVNVLQMKENLNMNKGNLYKFMKKYEDENVRRLIIDDIVYYTGIKEKT